MAKTTQNYSATAASNTALIAPDGTQIPLGEGQTLPKHVNDAFRALMADTAIAAKFSGLPAGRSIAVTVKLVSNTDALGSFPAVGGQKLELDGAVNPALVLAGTTAAPHTYTFDTSDSSMTGALRFYEDASQTTEYTTGVTVSSGQTTITVTNTTPGVLYYQLAGSAGLGGIAYVLGASAGGSSYTDADVNTHLNTSTANSGEVLSWDGNDYDWVAQSGGSSYTDADVNTHLNQSTANSGEVLQWDGNDYAWTNQTAAYTDADVNTHLNQSTANSGEVLQWDGNDYDWVAQTAAYTDADVNTHLNQSTANSGEVLQWDGNDYAWVAQSGGGSSTFAGLTEANTADVDLHDVALQAKTTYVVTAPSSSEYRFDINGTDNNPTIYVRAGETIAFDLTALAGSHPFQIEDNAGSAYSTGLVHIATDGTRTTGASAQGKTSGTLYWKVPASINGTYEYQCTSHGGMNGDIIVTPDSAAGGLQTEEHPTVTNGSATVTLANARTLNEIEVYLNGVKLRGGTTLGGTTEWTVSGTTLTFNQNLSTGDEVTVVSLVTATAALAEEFPTVTAGSADVTMSQAFTLSQIDVYLNGVRLKATDEYTVSGSTLTLGENLVSGDIVAVVPRIEATDVTLASLSDTNVTGVSDGELLRYDNSTSKYVPTSMVEDSSGNVGIGTSSPASTLDVDGEIRSVGVHLTQGNTGVVDARFAFDQDGTQVGWIGSPQWDSDGLYIYGPTASSGSEPVLKYSASQLELRTSNTNRLVINSSGELLIGYTSDNGNYRLQVNGEIFATSSTITTPSDQRYKENITPLTGAIDTVKALNPVQFDWKEHPVHEFDRSAPTTGFIAQEVQTALADKPWLNSLIKSNNVVIEPEQTDEDGNVIAEAVSEDFLGIAEGNLIAVLTAAIQEQQTQIEAQQATIEALEARLTVLEGA